MNWDPYHDYRLSSTPRRRWLVTWRDDKGKLRSKSFEYRVKAEGFAQLHPSVVSDRWIQ